MSFTVVLKRLAILIILLVLHLLGIVIARMIDVAHYVFFGYNFNNNKSLLSVEVEHPSFSAPIQISVNNDHSYSGCYETA